MVFQYPSKTLLKKHWFCSVRRKKSVKTSIGFIDRATELVEKPSVSQAKRPKQIEKPLVL